MAASNTVQVIEQFIHIERSHRGCKQGDGFQTGIKGLVCGPLVGIKSSTPVSFPVQAYIPVTQVYGNKILDQPGSPGGLIVFILCLHIFYQGIEQGDNPTVYFGSLLNLYLSGLVGKSVNVGIEREERVGIIKGSEKFSYHLVHSRDIKFQIIPGLCIGDHIPAQGIRAIFFNGFEGINSVAQTLRHLVTTFIQHQSVGDNVFEGDAIEKHGGDGMKREEPPARLVNPFGNKIGRKELVKIIFVFKGIVVLRIGHGSRIEPHIDQHRLAKHSLSGCTHQDQIVHKGSVQVKNIVVLF